jgi:MFS family permease
MTDSSSDSLSSGREWRAVLPLAGIFSLRMLGLFMIYPVFAVYARGLPDATPVTIGLALGIYGLAQAALQIPFGALSDRVGRHRMIAAGLLLFALGSAVAAMAETIHGIILGRFLQGTGAIGAVILALTADLTRDRTRTRAMAVIGMSIGMSFALAVVLGPVLDAAIGVSGIFWLTAALALAGIAVLFLMVPRPSASGLHRDNGALPHLIGRVLSDPQLLRLDFGILAQHAILTATFLALPVILHDRLALDGMRQWWLYLPVLAASVLLMVPCIIIAERRARLKGFFLLAVAVLALTQLMFALMPAALVYIVPVMILFFAAFNLLEASLPSMVSRLAPAAMKGTALGVYSSSQFLGIFLGGVLGGWFQSRFGLTGVFAFSGGLAVVWWLVSLGLRNPGHVSTRTIQLGGLASLPPAEVCERLRSVPGILDVAVTGDRQSALIKVAVREINEESLHRLVGDGASVP